MHDTIAGATFLEVAAPLVRFGVEVFPIIFGTKRPALREWQERATCDPDQLARGSSPAGSNPGPAAVQAKAKKKSDPG